jgi:hypothetical protein
MTFLFIRTCQITFLGLGLILSLVACDNNSTGEKIPYLKPNALTYCQILVKQSLRSPSTADFPFNPNITVSSDKKIYTIRSYVDAQNAFGATLRQNYHCKMHYTGIGPIDGLELLDFYLVN